MKSKRLGLFLMKKRLQLGLERIQLAQLLQIKEETVTFWELGWSNPSNSILSSLIQALDISLEEFVEHLNQYREAI